MSLSEKRSKLSCYFRCARPLNIFSDFNHVVSNVPYMIFGLAFLAVVRYKAHILPKGQKPKNDHR